MKDSFRKLNLYKLVNKPLTLELKRLDGAISFIEDVLYRAELKKDDNAFPEFEYYFLNEVCLIEYNIKHNRLVCCENNFYNPIERKFKFTQIQIIEILIVIVNDMLSLNITKKDVYRGELNEATIYFDREHKLT